MGMRRVIFILILLSAMQLSMPVLLRGQQFLWDVDVKFGFDNREYSSLTTSPSGTIFGTMLSPDSVTDMPYTQVWTSRGISGSRIRPCCSII